MARQNEAVSWSWPENINVRTVCSPVREVAHGVVRLEDSSLSLACCQKAQAAEFDYLRS